MIPGLVHGRLLGGGAPAGGPIAAPIYENTLAFAQGQTSAEVTGTFDIHPDGTWTSQGKSYRDGSGTWHRPVAAGAGNGYEVRITLTEKQFQESEATPVSGIISNDASDWVSLGSRRRLSLTVRRFTQGRSIAYYEARVQIRPAGGGAVVSTGKFGIWSQVQVDSSSGGGGSGGGGGGNGPIPELPV